MVDSDLNAGCEGGAREVVQYMTQSSPRFSFDQLAELCLATGMLNLREAQILRKRARFPDRVFKDLYSALSQTVEIANLTAKIQEEPLRRKSGNLALNLPVAQFVSGDLTKRFTSGSIPQPNMFITKGNIATHFAHPRVNISWSKDGVIGPRKDPSARFFLNFMQDVERTYLKGRTFMCVVRGSGSYGHWLLDTLPRILALIEAGENIDTFDQFVFLNMRRDFQRKTLEDLGIGRERIITLDNYGQLFQSCEFAFVSNPCPKSVPCAILSDMMCSFFGQPRKRRSGRRKIFISRSKATRRRILNESDVAAFLAPLGYERVCLEDISVQETARMFAEAEAVVGSHGAGLANIIFASPGTKILELFNSRLTRIFWNIANQNNLRYYAFEGNGPDGKELDPKPLKKIPNLMHEDMIIPMREFKEFMENQFERDRE